MEGYVETMFEILTTRFNSITYREMESWKEREEYRGSIYNTPVRMTDSISPNRYLFVLEMNNTLNKIMGIGLIKKRTYYEPRFKEIYNDYRFNNHTYKSKFHVRIYDADTASSLLEDENDAQFIEEEFEKIVFFGKSHLKRGQCFTRVPLKKVKLRHKMFLVHLFQKYCPGINALLKIDEEKEDMQAVSKK